MNNFYEHFAVVAGRHRERIAIEVQRRSGLETFTYGKLGERAERTAGWLARQGVKPGDRCAILGDNDAHWCAAYLGALRLGAVVVPLDTAYKPKQVAILLKDCDAAVLFTTPRFLQTARQAVTNHPTSCRLALLHDPVEDLPGLNEVVRSAPSETLPPSPATPADAAVMLYTSGTTSDPKGVVLTHGNLLAEMDAVVETVSLNKDDRILGVLPLFHALAQMANLLLPFGVGASVIFLETLNTTELLRALEQRGITIFCCVPQFFYLIHQRIHEQLAAAGWLKRTAFRNLLRVSGALRNTVDLNVGHRLFGKVHRILGKNMRLLVTGGSRLDPAIGRDFYCMGFDLLQAYGLTECSGGATLTRMGEGWTDSVGKPFPGVEVKIIPQEVTEGEGLRPGEGEVAIRGPIVMQGYHNRPEVNAKVLRDGWLHTGDVGFLDSGGRLHITGRKKEIIVLSSGKNIYPEEVETHYRQTPYIKEICVLGLTRPNKPAAERLHAVVVPDMDYLRSRKMVNLREILRFEIENLSIQLPGYKRILTFAVWTEDLPRTTTRKLKRFEIERRVRARQQERQQETVEEERAPAATQSEKDTAWAAQPEVSRAVEIIRKAVERNAPVHAAANIELDLGLDSMERIELLAQLENEFDAAVSDEIASSIFTVRELVNSVLSSKGQTDGSGRNETPWDSLLQSSLEDDEELAGLLKPKPLTTAGIFVLLKVFHFLAKVVLRFRVSGREHLPKHGPFLLCPNHQSYLDAFLLVSALPYRLFRNMFFVGASEYFETPLMRWLARKGNIVPVDPDANLLRAMQAGAFGLRHGKVLILFPEGERTIDGRVKKFKKGAAILSTHLAVPIAPVAMDGLFEMWPRGRSFQGLNRVQMMFGPPLSPAPVPNPPRSGEAEGHYGAITNRLQATVAELWSDLRQP